MHALPPAQASIPLLPRPHLAADIQRILPKLFSYLLAECLEDIFSVVLVFDLGYSTNFDANRLIIPYVER